MPNISGRQECDPSHQNWRWGVLRGTPRAPRGAGAGPAPRGVVQGCGQQRGVWVDAKASW